jgi:TrmH family RNA methyltransferase
LRSLRWPVVTAREAAAIAIQERSAGKVAVVFGRERSGLSNDELALCQKLLNIPVNPDFSSLNISAAVQVVCYELRVAALGDVVREPQRPDEEYATAGMIDSFHHQLEQDLIEIGFLDPDNPRQLPLKLRRLFVKARPTVNEIKIMRGILKGLSKKRASTDA